MTGTILNAAAILAGGIISLTTRQQLAEAHQRNLKVILSVLVVYAGLSMTWKGLHGSVWHQLKQLTIVIVAMMLGKFAGQKLRLQPALNRLGQIAKEKFVRAQPGDSDQTGEGFITCTLLFCAGPMAILGALCDGLFGDYRTLALKGVIDGLATFAFAKVFGWGVLLSVIPLVACQGSITLLARFLETHWLSFHNPALLNSIYATAGLLVFCLALIMLNLKKVELADYLPSLVFAPLITWVWR